MKHFATLRVCGKWIVVGCLSAVIFFQGAHRAQAQSVLPDMPSKIDPNARYVFYVHGRIIETKGTKAVSPQFGAYQFLAITSQLAGKGRHVIAKVRDPGRLEHVDELTADITRLLENGVSAQNITVVGFSKGGYMTLRTAKALENPDISYAVLAGCIEGVVSGKDRSADGLKGRFLSMVDASDDLGFSCATLFARNPHLKDPVDVVFETGLAHGLFYAADPVWLDPLQEWIKAQ